MPPVLVKEDHLKGFLTALGLSAESLAELSHENLLGFTAAVLDYEARAAYNPDTTHVYGHDGYMIACKTLSSGSTAEDTAQDYGTLSVRLAEQNIARLCNQISELEPADPDTPRLIRPVLSLLLGAGVLLNLTNSPLTNSEHRAAIRTAQGCIVTARQGVQDVKRSMRERGIDV